MATSRIVFYASPNAPRDSRVERGFGVSSHQSSCVSGSSGGSAATSRWCLKERSSRRREVLKARDRENHYEVLAVRPSHPRRIAAARRRVLCRSREHDTPENYRFRMRHATNCLWCLILPFEPDAACVCQRTLQLVRGYLATNKKKEASTDLELPWLLAPPLVWQFTQTALSSPARSAVLHQAFSVPNVRVSA
jgi:hypothetical protein